MWNRVVSEDSCSVRYVPDHYKTQQICDEAVDGWLAVLKFVLGWLVFQA